MKTEQEVREAITQEITRPLRGYGDCARQIIISKEELQDLAVIIGKALGVIEVEE